MTVERDDDESGLIYYAVHGKDYGFIANFDKKSDAYLTSEAFNVHHETGRTPRQLAERVKELEEALAKLSNEVLGSLPCMEPLARREFGNTNYNILVLRAEEARALLTKATGGAS